MLGRSLSIQTGLAGYLENIPAGKYLDTGKIWDDGRLV